MSWKMTLRQTGREWLVALCSYALLVAPFGCQISGLPSGGDDDDKPPTTSTAGLFVNPDATSPVLLGGRNADGDAFFVYGTRDAQGKPDISSILVQTKGGEKSFLLFKQGRPIYAQGPDGSYAKITYTEVTPTRLTGDVEIYNAKTSETATATATVDLTKAAEQIAAAVRNATGEQLDVPEQPDISTGKDDARSLSSILLALSIVPLVVFGQALVVVMGQVMMQAFAAVAVAMQAAVLAAFTPLFLFTSLLGETTVRIESVPLFDVFIEIPEIPHISIEFD